MAELNLLREVESRSPFGQWILRGGIAIFFLLVGLEKFSNEPAGHWVTMFQQIGAGVWLRYFTGAVEVFGAVLVLIPRAGIAGFALLACTMLGAMLILALVLGTPGDALFPGIFLIAVICVGWAVRRNA